MARHLQDVLEPHLEPLGFARKAKGFVGRSGELRMEIWFNPEPRLARVATVNVDCLFGDDPEHETFFSFDQAHAALGERRRTYLGVPLERRADVIEMDFARVTVPFIKAATSVDAVLEMLFVQAIPPKNLGRYPMSVVQQAIEIGTWHGLPDRVAQARALAATTRFSRVDHGNLVWWAEKNGLSLALLDPLPEPRRRWWSPRGRRAGSGR